MAYVEYGFDCKGFINNKLQPSIKDDYCVDWACAPTGAKTAFQAIFLYNKCLCTIKKRWCPPGKTPESYDEGGIVSQLSSISSSDVPSLLSQYWWIIAGGIIIYLLVKK